MATRRAAVLAFVLLAGCGGGGGGGGDDQPCDAGTYLAVDGSCQAWTTCGPGTYATFAGSPTMDRTCAGCASGTFSTTENSSACAAWATCAAGSFVTNTPSATTDRSCSACPAGMTTPEPNLAMCVLEGCDPGAARNDNDLCEACAPGNYCAGGDAAAVACAQGQWDHDANPATTCATHTACVAGQYVAADGSATSDRACAACPASEFSASDNAASCTPWRVCAAGTAQDNPPSATVDRTCAACPAGTYCAGATASQVACAAGTWDDDADAATPCVDRAACAPGEYVVADGDATTDRTCAACPASQYSSAANSASCTSWRICAAGTTPSNTPSATADRTCATCAAGTYCAGDTAAPVACAGGSWDDDASAATPCVAHRDCAPGQYVTAAGTATTNRACSACAASAFSTTTNALSCTPWHPCTAGTFQTSAASATADYTCEICAAGTWDDDANPTTSCVSALTCVPGSRVDTPSTPTSDRTCAACVAGTFSGQANQAACDACAAGTYAPGPNAAACAPWTTCAAGASYMTVAPTDISDRGCGTCADVVVNSRTLPTSTATDNAPACCTYLHPFPAHEVLVNAQFGDPADGNGAEYVSFGTPPCPSAGCLLISNLDASVPNYALVSPPETADNCPVSYTYTWEVRYPPALGGGVYARQNGRQLRIAPNAIPNAALQLWTMVLSVVNNTTGQTKVDRYRFVYDQSTYTLTASSNDHSPGQFCADLANGCACGICGSDP